MQHHFDTDIAVAYGINAAILLDNIYWWTEKNKANEKNFYDGYYWTYNSKKAFSKLFPYMGGERAIDYALKKLIDNGLIIKGNYNENGYDRTLWYAITKRGYSILQNCRMEETKLLNGLNKNVEPIPYIYTDNNTINNISQSKDENLNDNLSSFCDKYGIQIDTCSPLLDDMDFGLIAKAYDESEFLRTEPMFKFLSSIIKNYKKIIANCYKDRKKGRKGKEEDWRGLDTLNELYQECFKENNNEND